MEEPSARAFKHYLGLNLTNSIVSMFMSGLNGAYMVLGTQGVGKSTYAYYAAKTALIAFHCISANPDKRARIADKDAIMACAEREFGDICFGKDCEPDAVDKKMREWIFVGIEDINRLAEYLRGVVLERRKPLPVLFIDDIVLKGDWWLSKERREIIQSFRRINQFRRLAARVILATAPSADDVVELGTTFIKVHGKVSWDVVRFTRWAAQPVQKYVPVVGGTVTAWTNITVRVWMDEIPRRKEFGMPRWLEEQINERKRMILKQVLEKYTVKGKEGGEVGGEEKEERRKRQAKADRRSKRKGGEDVSS